METTWRKSILGVLLPFLAFALTGCGSGLVNIEGTVRLDGGPLPEGEIRFLPESGETGPSAGAIIKDGEYAVEVMPGKKRVEIYGYRFLRKNSIGFDVKDQIVPDKFNRQSELRREILGGETVDFDLTSKTSP